MFINTLFEKKKKNWKSARDPRLAMYEFGSFLIKKQREKKKKKQDS